MASLIQSDPASLMSTLGKLEFDLPDLVRFNVLCGDINIITSLATEGSVYAV